MKHLQDAGIDNGFIWINPVEKMYTIFSAVLCQQKESDVMTYFGLTARSAVYYQASSQFLFQTYSYSKAFRDVTIYRSQGHLNNVFVTMT
jgi:hypothetical protein